MEDGVNGRGLNGARGGVDGKLEGFGNWKRWTGLGTGKGGYYISSHQS